MGSHITFSIDHAIKYGTDCACIIHHFQYWIETNQLLGRNFIDGRTWMYQTQKEMAAIFRFMSPDAVQRNLKKLVDEGVLIKGNFNKNKFDQTLWYAFKNEEIFIAPRNRGIVNAISQNQFHDPAASHITDVLTNIKEQQTTRASAQDLVADAPIAVADAPAAVASLDKKNQKAKITAKPKSFEVKKAVEKKTDVKVYDCLAEIDIPQTEKEWLSRNYDENTVKNAIEWATDAQTKISTTLCQALKWACLKRIQISRTGKESVSQKVEQLNDLLSNVLIPKGVDVSVGNSYVSITYKQCPQHPGFHISFTEKGFIHQLTSALNKTGCIIKK